MACTDASCRECYPGNAWGLTPPTPSPTGTELALNEAKRHIEILTKFWMDNAAWRRASEDARAFISGKPRQE